MVAVEASLVLNEIATGERMTPGQNEAESRYVAAPCDTPMYLFQLDFWTEAFPRHWHEEWGIAVIHQGVNRFWFRGAWHSAGPGAIIVVPPGEVHDGGVDKDSVWGERMLLRAGRFYDTHYRGLHRALPRATVFGSDHSRRRARS